MSELILTPQVFTILSGLIEERVGLSYTLADKSLLESKVAARALEAGFDSLLDYYYYLRYDDGDQREFAALAEALLVHETYLFREFDPLRVAIEEFVVPAVNERGRARIWCAACSTGEEPVTAAMLLAEQDLLSRVELVASDLSESALARARRGVFRPRALRQQPHHPLAARYLVQREQELHAQKGLVDAIRFARINLIDSSETSTLGTFDLILCRNVLIYFRDERTREVVQRLTDQLRVGGALLVGVSESLMRFGSALSCEEHRGVFVYRKLL